MPGNNRQRPPEAGITLVEVLVVLVLISVLAGALALSLGPASRTAAPAETAERLVARLARAGELAQITGSPAALVWRDDGYRFLSLQDGAWAPHPAPLLARPEVLPAHLRLAMADASVPVTGSSFVLSPDALLAPGAAPLALVLRSREGGSGWLIAHDGATARLRAMQEVRP